MAHSEEFEKFDRTMRKLMSVPHSAIKAKLDAEKADKEKRPKKKGRPLDIRKQDHHTTK